MYFKKVCTDNGLSVKYHVPTCDAILRTKRGVATCNSMMIMVKRYTEGRVRVLQFKCLSCGRLVDFKIYQELEE